MVLVNSWGKGTAGLDISCVSSLQASKAMGLLRRFCVVPTGLIWRAQTLETEQSDQPQQQFWKRERCFS